MEKPEYFDNVTIGQFVLTGLPVKVYVNGRYLTITDADDVEDDDYGLGMDEDGDMIYFDYRMVEHLSVSGQVINLETYIKALEDEEQKDAAAGGSDDKEAGDTEKEDKKEKDDKKGKEDKKEKEDKNPFESVRRGKRLLEISKEELDAETQAVEAKIKAAQAKITAQKKRLAKLKKQPIDIEENTISEPYIYNVGDVVQNVNRGCPHYGSIGVVQRVYDMEDDIPAIIYRVLNNGSQFDVGDILTKSADQLDLYTGE
jgi:hypothetical protein